MLFAHAPKRPKKRNKYTKFKQYPIEFGGRQLLVQGFEPQALKYLVEECGFKPNEIKCECEFGDALSIRYTYGKKHRTYMPDIYVPKARLIVEVKSWHTLGLNHNKKRGWSMTCAKAIACHKKGFRFMLLLLDNAGRRTKMPRNWPYMKKAECVAAVRSLNPINSHAPASLL